MLFEQFSHEEVATVQLPCVSYINIYYYCSMNKDNLHILFTYLNLFKIIHVLNFSHVIENYKHNSNRLNNILKSLIFI